MWIGFLVGVLALFRRRRSEVGGWAGDVVHAVHAYLLTCIFSNCFVLCFGFRLDIPRTLYILAPFFLRFSFIFL